MLNKAIAALLITAIVLGPAAPASAHDPVPPKPQAGWGDCSSGDGAVIVNKSSAADVIAAYLVKGVLGDACIYGVGETLHASPVPVIVIGGTRAVPDDGIPEAAQRIGGKDRYETAELVGKWATTYEPAAAPVKTWSSAKCNAALTQLNTQLGDIELEPKATASQARRYLEELRSVAQGYRELIDGCERFFPADALRELREALSTIEDAVDIMEKTVAILESLENAGQ